MAVTVCGPSVYSLPYVQEDFSSSSGRSGGCPVLGHMQGQAGGCSEHLVELWVPLYIAGELV